jgi:polynucleotide 5'-hydroxyl-kinase GRC3/NOL9
MKEVEQIHVPDIWPGLPLSKMHGTIMVIGETDTGKSTFCRWLVEGLAESSRTAWLDCDMGQSTLGVPSTMNLGFSGTNGTTHSTTGFFVGKTSPVGHMLPTMVGARLLLDEAQCHGMQNVVVDTSGLVSRRAGGGALKEWKMELLRPRWIVALARGRELEHIIAPLRKSEMPRLFMLPPSPRVVARSRMERASLRQERFHTYFSQARTWTITLNSIPVFGLQKAKQYQLAGLLDGSGLLVSLCIVMRTAASVLEILAPEHDQGKVRAVRIGNMRVEPESGMEVKS